MAAINECPDLKIFDKILEKKGIDIRKDSIDTCLKFINKDVEINNFVLLTPLLLDEIRLRNNEYSDSELCYIKNIKAKPFIGENNVGIALDIKPSSLIYTEYLKNISNFSIQNPYNKEMKFYADEELDKVCVDFIKSTDRFNNLYAWYKKLYAGSNKDKRELLLSFMVKLYKLNNRYYQEVVDIKTDIETIRKYINLWFDKDITKAEMTKKLLVDKGYYGNFNKDFIFHTSKTLGIDNNLELLFSHDILSYDLVTRQMKIYYDFSNSGYLPFRRKKFIYNHKEEITKIIKEKPYYLFYSCMLDFIDNSKNGYKIDAANHSELIKLLIESIFMPENFIELVEYSDIAIKVTWRSEYDKRRNI